MYSFEVPRRYLEKLVEIRERTGKPLRRQMCAAIEYYLKMAEADETFAERLLKEYPKKFQRSE